MSVLIQDGAKGPLMATGASRIQSMEACDETVPGVLDDSRGAGFGGPGRGGLWGPPDPGFLGLGGAWRKLWLP